MAMNDKSSDTKSSEADTTASPTGRKGGNALLTLLDLFVTFAKIGSVTFGGGMAMMPIMERELIDKRKWIVEEELIDYYAIGQSTPGIIAVNVSTFIGCKRLGWIGGMVATAGMVAPSLIIICLIALFIDKARSIPLAQRALHGVNIAVAALLTHVLFTFSKKTVKGWVGALCLASSFALIFFLHIKTYFVIIGAALLGIAIYAWKNRKANTDKEAK